MRFLRWRFAGSTSASVKQLVLAASAVLTLLAAVLTVVVTRPQTPLELRLASLDPYDDPLLVDYKSYRDALLQGDTASLEALAQQDGYASYRAALSLARDVTLEPATRTHYYRRVFALRTDDPLDKLDKRALLLEYAATAEAAGLGDEALEAYAAALPAAAATAGLKRLQTDPYRLANTFLQARRYQDALKALGDLGAPSIEAPAYRALGDYAAALDAYQRWLAEQPGNRDARYGEAWTHYYLGDLTTADALFATLSGPSALKGRALVARQRGDTDGAVAFLTQSGEPANLWLATGYLEAADRYRDALGVYLQLAALDSVYADDAAYRAYVLAGRLNEPTLAETAEAYLRAGSFFGLKVGKPLQVPTTSVLERVTPPAVEVALALARINDLDGAQGELLFALRDAVDVPERVALAESLQLLGEFRQSQRAGVELLAAGVIDRRVWELAYPRAYPGEVDDAAGRNGLEPALVWAVMRQESAFFPKALSSSNAQGLMQVIPSTWDWLAELQRETPGEPFDISTNVRYGSFYLRWLLNYLGGDPELVIASYNRGQGYIKRLYESSLVSANKDELYREIDALETREYLQRVSENYEVYKALYPTTAARP